MQEAPDDIQFFIPYILKWMWLSVASLLILAYVWKYHQCFIVLCCTFGHKLLRFWALLSWLIFGCVMLNLIHTKKKKKSTSEKCFLLKAPDIRGVTLRRDSVTWSRTQTHSPDGSERLRSQDSNMTTPTTHQVSLWYLYDIFILNSLQLLYCIRFIYIFIWMHPHIFLPLL